MVIKIHPPLHQMRVSVKWEYIFLISLLALLEKQWMQWLLNICVLLHITPLFSQYLYQASMSHIYSGRFDLGMCYYMDQNDML